MLWAQPLIEAAAEVLLRYKDLLCREGGILLLKLDTIIDSLSEITYPTFKNGHAVACY